jgi:ketosteroid isomerase-like protein
MPDGHEAIVQATVDAYNRGDIEGVLARVTEDIDLRPPSHLVDGVIFRGHAGVRAWAQRATEMWSESRSTAKLVASAGDHLVVAIDYELVGRDSGVPITQRSHAVYTLRDGKIAATIAYASEAEAITAMVERATAAPLG